MNKSWKKIREIILQLRGLTTIGIADILGSVIAAIFWFYMARMLGEEQYGLISYLLAITGIASAVSLIGSENTLQVYTAKNVKIQATVYFVALITALFASIVIFFIFHNLGVSILVTGYVIFGLAVSELLGRKLYTVYSKYVITQKILMIGIAVSLYYLIGADGIILGMALSFLPYTVRIYKAFQGSRIDFSLIKPRFGFMMNSYVLSLSGVAIRSTDKLIIVQMLGLTLLGNYQLGIQFLEILQILPAIIYKYILPHDAIGNTNKKLKKVSIYVTIGLVILVFSLSPIIVPIMFPKFTKAIEVIQVSSLAVIPSSISVAYISKFLANEKSRIVLASSGLYFVVQVIAIVLLGKLFGIIGVTSALVLAGIAQTLFLVIVNRFKGN